MKAADRRKKMMDILSESTEPVSGSALARMLSVSRQVIVTDIAILRAEGMEITSTSHGYLVVHEHQARRIFKVQHSREDCEKELNLFVDCGAIVKDRTSWSRSAPASPHFCLPPRKAFITTPCLLRAKRSWT